MSMNPYRTRRRAFANPDFTSNNYAGGLTGPIISAALSAGDTLANGWVRQIDGIQYKTNISESSITNPLVAAGCDFSSTESLAVADKVLTLVDMKVNEEICRATVYPTFQGQSGSRASSNMMTQEFVNHILGLVAAKTAEQVETIIWKGDGTLGVRGFLSNDGTLDSAGFAASSLANATTHEFTAAIAAGNTFARFNDVYSKAATTKPAVLAKSDLAFYVSPKTYALYLYDLATAGGSVALSYDSTANATTQVNTNGTGYGAMSTNQGFGGVTYLGIPIYRVPGMFDDCIVLGQSENLIFGSNANTDLTDVKFIPVYEYDGSDNVRVVMQMAFNTIAGVASDVIVGYNLA